MEIEFRGKWKGSKYWIYGCYYYVPSLELHQILCQNCEGYFLIDPETIGQYTTKKDIEGTKLFVGDIIEYDGMTYEIIFQEEEARFIGINYPTMISALDFCKAKKIGTKFD